MPKGSMLKSDTEVRKRVFLQTKRENEQLQEVWGKEGFVALLSVESRAQHLGEWNDFTERNTLKYRRRSEAEGLKAWETNQTLHSEGLWVGGTSAGYQGHGDSSSKNASVV